MDGEEERPITVVKYGGAALGRGRDLASVTADLRRGEGPRVVVVSAREGVTDLLKGCLSDPGNEQLHEESLRDILARHPAPPEKAASALDALRADLARLRRAAARGSSRGRSLRARSGGGAARRTRPGSLSPRPAGAPAWLADQVLAQGERIAAHWATARLREAGLPAVALEADRIGLRTDGRHGDAMVRLAASESAVRRAVLPRVRRGELPVVTGFLGRSPQGRVVTLGRGGSDYTATALGNLLGAGRVELVKKDVSILTADPRLVPAARPLTRLSYEEAEELAQFGAKVLHPLTVEPARARGVEIVIRSLDDPRRATRIGPALPGQGIRALTLLAPTSMLLLRVPGGRQKKGVIAEVSRALARNDLNVITMFTSSAVLIVLVEHVQGRKARRVLDPFARAEGSSLEGPLPAALVTAIGEGVLADLGGLPAELSVRAVGVSGTARTLSLAVPEARGREALVSLHRTLVEGRHPPEGAPTASGDGDPRPDGVPVAG